MSQTLHREAAESSVSSADRVPAVLEATTLATDSGPRSRADDIRLILADGLSAALPSNATVDRNKPTMTASGNRFSSTEEIDVRPTRW